MSNELAVQAAGQDPYFGLPGLSQSGMKDLEVSPLRYWFKHVNPNREQEEPTAAMQFGSAVHCAVLEPDSFHDRYASELDTSKIEGLLVTIDDLRRWLKDKAQEPKGTKKADIISQVQAVDINAPILEVMERQHFKQNEGKVLFKADDWKRIAGAAQAILNEPIVSEALAKGEAEVWLSATDPETGVPLKGKADWIGDKYTLDLKTFTQMRGRSIDASVNAAIQYEKYYRQAWLYAHIQELMKLPLRPYLAVFVESDPPHETRLRVIGPKVGGNPNVFWMIAENECRSLINTYAENMAHFGENPWRYAQKANPLTDENVKGMIF